MYKYNGVPLFLKMRLVTYKGSYNLLIEKQAIKCVHPIFVRDKYAKMTRRIYIKII